MCLRVKVVNVLYLYSDMPFFNKISDPQYQHYEKLAHKITIYN